MIAQILLETSAIPVLYHTKNIYYKYKGVHKLKQNTVNICQILQ